MVVAEDSETKRVAFENAIKALETQLANAGAHLTIDSHARLAYSREIKTMAEQLRRDATAGKISWAAAAQQAQEMRNLIMEIVRGNSTPIGRSLTQKLKASGHSLNDLVARQTVLRYGAKSTYSGLSSSQKNKIFADIVISAGKSNPVVNQAMSRLSHAGRGLLFVSLSLSVYNVATSDNKMGTAKRELTATGAGIGGGIAGGALAGLACGPGAPVCVTVGAFVGGTLSAFGSSFIW